MCSLKKLTVLASSLSLSLLVAALVGCDAKNVASTDPDKTPAEKSQAELLAMGEKLVKHGECMSCHSPIRPVTVDGKVVVMPDVINAPLGGGNAWFTPGAGIGVSANINPAGAYMKNSSVEGLVAKWADKTKTYLPPMPALGQVYTEEELTAIATYLKSDKIAAFTEEPPASYYFAMKDEGDETWPVPGPLVERLNPSDPKRILPGSMEISVSPFTDGQLSQTMINTNIAEAKKAPAN